MIKNRKVSFIVFGFLLICATTVLIDWLIFLNTPIVPSHQELDYIFPKGASIHILADDMQSKASLKRPGYFIALAYLTGDAKKLRAGEYMIEGGTKPEQLLYQISHGKVLWRHITFIEGWTFYQMMQELNHNTYIQHTLTGLPNMLVMMKLGIPVISPEGEFFPDTYNYTYGMTDKEILLNAHRMMQNHLNQAWVNRDISVPYDNPYQALIVASIIEKEGKVNSERPEIAGVLLKRLSMNMLLQMDSTVVYALGPSFTPPVTHQDLSIDSPYNTYIYKGLPPTPIAMPGLPSIEAALHPNNTNNLYFVARGDGSHQFSSTYQSQVAAIQKYQRQSYINKDL